MPSSNPPPPALTTSEYLASLGRICRGALDGGLTVTPLPAIAGGAVSILAVAAGESRLWLRPAPASSAAARNLSEMGATRSSNAARYRFMLRYGLHQIVPSLIWETQPATIVAESVGLPPRRIYGDAATLRKENPRNYLRYVRCVSIRGAIAGGILLSQVVRLVGIGGAAHEDYVRRIREGKEPPLDVPSQGAQAGGSRGVVVRLAGETSDVTTLSMSREGRRRIFPIFENSDLPHVQSLIRDWSCGGLYDEPRVPIYWNVKNGRYGRSDSWRGLRIPSHWLFDVALTAKGVRERRPRRLLVLEADATSGESDALSLRRHSSAELDLDLYEVAQGFHNLQRCVDAPGDGFDTLRVLLVDPEIGVCKGGGCTVRAGDYVRALGLADVVVDARAPLILAMTEWLRGSSSGGNVRRKRAIGTNTSTPVILETPREEWFRSIRSELAPLGYEVICHVEALRRYGRDGARDKPWFVYEKSISDTVHTIKKMVEQDFARKDGVCALFPNHMDEDGASDVPTASICSTGLYNRLLLWVRSQALQGRSSEDIQRSLDENLGSILIGEETQRL